jgi:Queuosine biosynthesis protein
MIGICERSMLLHEFDYLLPRSLIAQQPLAQRDASRMMFLDRTRQEFEDRRFSELPGILRPGDLLCLTIRACFRRDCWGTGVGRDRSPSAKVIRLFANI